MPLLSLVASSPEAVCQLTIEQVVATAGEGRLRDGTESQRELREYLRQVAVDALATYADYCLGALEEGITPCRHQQVEELPRGERRFLCAISTPNQRMQPMWNPLRGFHTADA
jgi:hypothetical protein